MSKSYKVVPSGTARRTPRISPMRQILQGVDRDFWTTKQVAEHLDVHVETIRRRIKAVDAQGNKVVKAPREEIQAGKVHINIFQMEDVVELENYFYEEGYSVKNRVDQNKPLKDQVPTHEDR